SLQKMPVSRILRAMDFGLMMTVAQPLRRSEREAIASFLGRPGEIEPLPASAFCSEKLPSLSNSTSPSWIGWSPTFRNTRFQVTEQAGLTAAQTPRLKLKWAFGFPGDIVAFGAPTVLNRVLFTGSAAGIVYSMNSRTGCLYWTFQAHGPVRSAPLVVEIDQKRTILFGDLVGWFYAVDAETGKQIWIQKIDDHEAARLTGSAVFHNGTVYIPASSWEESRAFAREYPCCTFRGSVTALRISDGSLIWKTFLVEKPQKTGATGNGTPVFG